MDFSSLLHHNTIKILKLKGGIVQISVLNKLYWANIYEKIKQILAEEWHCRL